MKKVTMFFIVVLLVTFFYDVNYVPKIFKHKSSSELEIEKIFYILSIIQGAALMAYLQQPSVKLMRWISYTCFIISFTILSFIIILLFAVHSTGTSDIKIVLLYELWWIPLCANLIFFFILSIYQE